MDDPWVHWNEIAGLELSDVPPASLPLYMIGWLRTEVGSDGFEGVFFYWYGDFVPDAVAVIKGAGMAEFADLVERAMAVLGDPYPLDMVQRQTVLLAQDEDDPRLHDLDREFYALEESHDLDELMRSVVVDT